MEYKKLTTEKAMLCLKEQEEMPSDLVGKLEKLPDSGRKIKKTVKYNGENIKVDFQVVNMTRIVDKLEGVRIVEAHGTHDFIINGKSYQVGWTMKNKNTSSVRLHFEGFTCGDSEKKMIEHIISKYGI